MVSASYPAGSKVEVRSNEEGFKGAWFEATVIQPIPKYRRYTIAYDSLVSDDAPSRPLEDTVHCFFVRPRPPPRPDPAARFELHQLVEAFHNDGWWKGVVSEVPRGKGGAYRICFPISREEFEFKAKAMREQLIWIKGNWVAVKDQKVEEDDLAFVVGSRVEVSKDKENFGAAWFTGTVLKVIGKSTFLVEYESQRVDNQGSSGELLKEIVDLQYIRPSPPPASKFDSIFDVLEEVEAFYKGGWIAGVVLELRGGSRYIVKARHEEEEFEVDQSAIRPRFEWINEHWTRISRDKSGIKSSNRRRKSLAAKKSSFPISTPSFSGDDGEVAGTSDVVSLKAKDPEEPRVEDFKISQPCRKLENRTSPEEHLNLVDETSYNHTQKSLAAQNPSLPISAPSFNADDDEVGVTSDNASLKPTKADEPQVEDFEISQSCKKLEKENLLVEQMKLVDETKSIGQTRKRRSSSQLRGKLKKENSLEEHLKLVDETRSIGRACKRRSHAAKRSRLLKSVLFFRNNNGEVDDKFGIANLKDKKVKEFTSEERAISSNEKQRKGELLEEHLHLVDSTLMDCSNKTSRMVGKSCSALPKSDDSPALVTVRKHYEMRSRRKPGRKSLSLSFRLSKELCNEQNISRMNGTESTNNIEESSSCSGDIRKDQLKTSNFSHSPIKESLSNTLPNVDVRNCKSSRGLMGSGKRKRKKLARRTRKRKICDVVDVQKHALGEIKKRKRGRPPKQNATCMNGGKFNHLEERNAIVVCDNDGREFVELSNHTPIDDVSGNVKSISLDKVKESMSPMLAVNAKRTTANDVFGICLCNMQADIMEDSPQTPEIEPSIVVAKSLKYSTIQQSPVLESFDHSVAVTETEARKSMEDNVQEHDKLIQNGLENQVEMEKPTVDPTPNGLTLLEEYNVCDHDGSTTCESQFEKVSLEIKDRASLDHSPNGSSLSREDCIPGHIGSTQGGPLPEKTFTEMEKAPRDPTHCGTSPSREGISDYHKPNPNESPAEKAIVDVEGRTEIVSIPRRSFSNEVALPFIKESTMWEIVETMEVFRGMPQQPHFHPLEQYEVQFREGMAIGLMVTFANLVESIQKLRITDSIDIFEEKLKALVPLELNGFNVPFIRSRLEKLLEIRSNATQSEGETASLKEKIMEEEEERDQLDTLIAAHDKIIMDLEEHLHRYREKRTSVLVGRDRKDSEIVRLKLDLQTTEEAYFSAEEHFNAVVDAPWEM